MERVVAVKINKVAVGMIMVGLTVQAGVLAWLVWPRKVKNQWPN